MATTAGWQFERSGINDHQDDPVSDAFFSASGAENHAQALVRESVQNSLDAGMGSPVRIRFHIEETDAVQNIDYFKGLLPHVRACEIGLGESFDINKCRYLVVEDFNTTGLMGGVEIRSEEAKASPKENGYWFYAWATGISPGHGKRGTWGIGKVVFPRASALKCTFSYTVRYEDEEQLLFGQAVLKHHTLGTDSLKPYPWWGGRRNDRLVPFTDERIPAFKSDWGIARKDAEAGLSIVVPYVDSELTIQVLRDCLIGDYFVAFVRGQLTCELSEGNAETTIIDSTTIYDLLTELAARKKQMTHLPKLAQMLRAADGDSNEAAQFHIDLTKTKNKWEGVTLAEDEMDACKNALAAGKTLVWNGSLILPTSTRQAGELSDIGRFRLLMSSSQTAHKATFSRDGILISKAGKEAISDVVCLVLLESATDEGRSLAAVLSQAEGPAHSDWVSNEEKYQQFKPRELARSVITAVRSAPAQLARVLFARDDAADFDILGAYFSDRALTGPPRAVGRTAGESEDGIIVEPIDQSDPDEVHITRTASGFKVVPTRHWIPKSTLYLAVAYQRRGSHSVGGWAASDFLIADRFDASESYGGSPIFSGNETHFEPVDNDFALCFEGFDPIRDLAVKCTIETSSPNQGAKE